MPREKAASQWLWHPNPHQPSPGTLPLSFMSPTLPAAPPQARVAGGKWQVAADAGARPKQQQTAGDTSAAEWCGSDGRRHEPVPKCTRQPGRTRGPQRTSGAPAFSRPQKAVLAQQAVLMPKKDPEKETPVPALWEVTAFSQDPRVSVPSEVCQEI